VGGEERKREKMGEEVRARKNAKWEKDKGQNFRGGTQLCKKRGGTERKWKELGCKGSGKWVGPDRNIRRVREGEKSDNLLMGPIKAKRSKISGGAIF